MNREQREKKRRGIGKRIAEARKTQGLSQQRVANALGIPQRTVSFYERGEGDLPSSLLVPLADVLGVEVCWLLGQKPAASCASLRKQAGRGYLQERFDAVREMPRKDQQFVVKFLDQVLEDYARRKRPPKGRALPTASQCGGQVAPNAAAGSQAGG